MFAFAAHPSPWVFMVQPEPLALAGAFPQPVPPGQGFQLGESNLMETLQLACRGNRSSEFGGHPRANTFCPTARES